MARARSIGLILLAIGAGAAAAGTGPWPGALLPDFVRGQFAGNAGMFSGGAGYALWRGCVEPSLNLGFEPAMGGGRGSAILSQKTTIAPVRIPLSGGFDWQPVVLGGSANVSLGRQYEVIQGKSQFGYYWPDGLFFWFLIGTKAGYRRDTGPVEAIALQAEAGSLNQYWEANWGNRAVTWQDVISFAISTQVYF